MIRAVVVGDAERVAELVAALLTELTGTPRAADAALAARVLANARVTGFLAEAGGAAQGVLMLSEGVAVYAGGAFGTITELYVSPEARSSGIASGLIAAAVAEGRARGWGRLEVGAPAQPRWARSLGFYLREGFAEVGPRLRLIL